MHDPDGYRRSPNWRGIAGDDPKVMKRITGEVIRFIKQRVKNAS